MKKNNRQDQPRHDAKNGIFFIRQSNNSNNCRLNTINAFFGYEKYTSKNFATMACAFDTIYKTSGSKNFTSFVEKSDGTGLTSIVSYIIEMDNRFRCITCLPNEELFDDDDFVAICLFNNEHMWLEKLVETQWYRIDSRSRKPVKIKKPSRQMTLGRIYILNK